MLLRPLCAARLEAEACDPFSYDDDDEDGLRDTPRRDVYGRSPGSGSVAHRCVVVATRTAADVAEEAQIALALALSLSMCDAAPADGDVAAADGPASWGDALPLQAGPPAEASPPPHALSYEALVQLEAVRSVATSAEVEALPSQPFDAAAHGGDARCPICLDPLGGDGGNETGDDLGVLRLSCGHAMHARCGRDYLLRWSKRCAEVHCRRSVRPCDADEHAPQ